MLLPSNNICLVWAIYYPTGFYHTKQLSQECYYPARDNYISVFSVRNFRPAEGLFLQDCVSSPAVRNHPVNRGSCSVRSNNTGEPVPAKALQARALQVQRETWTPRMNSELAGSPLVANWFWASGYVSHEAHSKRLNPLNREYSFLWNVHVWF